MEDLKQRMMRKEEFQKLYAEQRIDYIRRRELLLLTGDEKIIKDLAFELSEVELNVEIWQNTDEMSQARIKKLEEREAKLVEAFNLLLLRSQEAVERLEYLETVTEFKNFSSIQCLNRAIQHVETIKEELGIANKGEV